LRLNNNNQKRTEGTTSDDRINFEAASKIADDKRYRNPSTDLLADGAQVVGSWTIHV